MSRRPEGSAAYEPTAVAAPSRVVGVGASAGGLEACQRLLGGAPTDAGLAFVIVLHLAPAEQSHVAEILQRETGMRVSQVTGGERVEADHVYVIAPGTSLAIHDGVLTPGAPDEPHYRARPIDAFFAALAADRGSAAAAVVLSGTGEDGSAGLKEIHAAGGLCLVQEPATAGYDGMPHRAIETGVADAVVPPEEMGAILARGGGRADDRSPEAGDLDSPAPATQGSASSNGEAAETSGAAGAAQTPDEALEAVLDLLGTLHRLDFRDYKRGTMHRRTERRIQLHRLDGWQAYLDFLAAHPEEVEALYGDLLVGVTGFFRDPDEWDLLAREVVPEMVADLGDAAAVRAWSAGCATGEEAYGLAMLLLEHLDTQHLDTKGRRVEVKIFASDASPAALAIARRGAYPAAIRDQVSAERLERFFQPSGEGFEVARDLRTAVTFTEHDLLADPPFAHLDLVACRNVLIYLEPAAQERLLERFHFALRPGGVLWLGASETVGRRPDLFAQLPGGHRIYRATASGRARGSSLAARRRPGLGPLPAPPGAEGSHPKVPRLIERLVLQRHTSPCVVVGQGLEILYFFGPTERYLERPEGEVRLDLLAWVRPELYARLRAGLAEALEQRQPVTLTGLRLEGPTEARRVEIAIEPIAPGLRPGGLLLVAFRDLPGSPPVVLADGEADDEAGGLAVQVRQELHDTREQLRTAVDQLRTASEEHAASYEELLSLNEELQSSNEELEASKEELQSLNEELTTTNRQLEERNEELRTLTSDLDNLLTSANVPTVFLDRELRIRRFTPATTDVLHVVPADAGRPLADLTLHVDDDRLLADAERVLDDPTPIATEVRGESGRWFARRALPYRNHEGEVDGVCLTFHEITEQKRATEASENARLYAEAVIRTSRTPLLVLDMDHRVVSANAAFYAAFEIDEAQTVGRRIYELGNGQWAIPRVRALLEEAPLREEREVRDYDVEHVFENIGWRSMRLNADVMPRKGRPDLILVSIEDVTDLRKAQVAAQSRADDLARDHRRKDEFLAMLGHELRNPLAALAHGVELLGREGAVVEPIRALMERQTRRMTALLDQLLDVARVISGKLELVREAADVAEAARTAVESVQPLFEAAGQQLTVSLPPAGSVLVLGDVARLAQVTENLLANATKYTQEGGHVSLALEATDDTVELSVRDDGIGVEPGLLAHIFDLFTQAPTGLDRAKGGLGLGLALVRSLVEMHGGTVEAFSGGEGRGTEIVVTLPRLRAGRRAAHVTHDETAARPAPHRVLVVDDETDAAEALAQILALEGHTARAVPDGETALEVAPTFQPELVLLDLGLPRMDGYEVARKLRESLEGDGVKIVALTGYRDDQDLLSQAGFDGYLLKPTSLDALFALMAKLDRGGETTAKPPTRTSKTSPPDRPLPRRESGTDTRQAPARRAAEKPTRVAPVVSTDADTRGDPRRSPPERTKRAQK
ncbi:MAG TPA: CheR family methyltransferase [Thermoanaerobaculia bacterium]|nr:CheR family methyltransferase [Thermoanaerobaculia bacterium]